MQTAIPTTAATASTGAPAAAGPAPGWLDLLSLRLAFDSGVTIQVGPVLALAILVIVGVYLVRLVRARRGPVASWEPVEANIKLGGIGDVKVKPNYETIQIAHRVWVELATRSAGIPFDPDFDVIDDIYESWHTLFLEIRALAKDVPAQRLRDDADTQKLCEVIVDALNRGLRPHLTRWHARFRRWYAEEAKNHPDEAPQEIQRRFAQYGELVGDLKTVNTQILEYMNWLKEIAIGRS